MHCFPILYVCSKTMDLKGLEHYAAFSINDIGV